jgi:3',5'-nucleoside bisphosphate phosphatase
LWSKLIRVDLHIHTDRSDGAETPAAVVRAAHAAGLDTIAITDHDSVGGLAEASRQADECGIRLIPGVEMTACVGRQHEVHLLAYFNSLSTDDATGEDDSLLSFLREVQHLRRERLRAGIRALRTRGVLLAESDVLTGPSESVTRLHLARALMHAGYVKDENEAFRRYLGDQSGSVPTLNIDPATVTALVHSRGGMVIWAHPGAEEFEAHIDALVAAGIDGVETHNFRRRETAGSLLPQAIERGLIATGGSDWHGGPHERPLGTDALPAELAERFLEVLQAKGSA